ncbi:MAG: hypothetical protein AVDCRST_MAG33-2992, partial [uncultured Thermomicrobiales bacterium]
ARIDPPARPLFRPAAGRRLPEARLRHLVPVQRHPDDRRLGAGCALRPLRQLPGL